MASRQVKRRTERLRKKIAQGGVCVVCGRPVLGCDQDDKCEATIMCMIHYYAYGSAMGLAESFGWMANESAQNKFAEWAEIDKEAKRIAEWKGVVDSALERAGFRHG